MSQRKKVSTTGSIPSRSARPTTKLPAQKRVAIVNANIGEHSSGGRRVVPLAICTRAAVVMVAPIEQMMLLMMSEPEGQGFDTSLTCP